MTELWTWLGANIWMVLALVFWLCCVVLLKLNSGWQKSSEFWCSRNFQNADLAKARGRTIHTLSLALRRKHREAARMHEAVRRRNEHLAKFETVLAQETEISQRRWTLLINQDEEFRALKAQLAASNLTDAPEYRKVDEGEARLLAAIAHSHEDDEPDMEHIGVVIPMPKESE